MLLPIIIFLIVLSPLFVPVGVTVIHGFGNLPRPAARPLRQFRRAVGPLPAAA
jgi:hypothetical protein